ncbi:MAG: hypothetical protein HYV90_01060 [Candidatus Woesebacteria bacterium]|nr:MAG: hypothetical protein HYV90_01060 [Candidatus Woesebacteria bacterium]
MDINSVFKSPFTAITDTAKLVTLFLNTAFVISGLILLFFFIMGGIGMISSAGQSDPQKAEQAKKTVTSALIGFIIVFASYWIVQLVGNITNVPILPNQ